MPSDDIRRHNVIHRSLREHLVPMSVWFESMKSVECTGPFSGDVGSFNNSDWMDRMYTVPYPFKTPIWVEILKHREATTGKKYKPGEAIELSDAESQFWLHNMSQRTMPFIENRIHDEIVTELDNQYDTGCFIHNTSGAIYPFEYSKLNGIDLVILPVSATLLLAKLSPTHMNVPMEQYQVILQNLTSHVLDYDMFYQPNFRYPDGDRYSKPGDYGRISYRMPIPRKDVEELTTYINTMFNAHSKCILIP